ncbi:uncharacterized protein LOC134180010 isoform X2 [Corticium candelabrum]|uniref:uncharacterized protein LOC134180010 isoform X2 n=1 Tax=Corticium candelabrum TaxID=121492 RepID=UPI002E266148|nr:uncharacterized protein LOC134180010 isoform X2 [Corticium candelabrum]
MASSARSASHVETDDDVWCVVRSNYVYLSDRLRFNSLFPNLLYERGFLSRGDIDALRSDFVTHDDKVRRLLIDVLSTRPPEMFPVFCDILKTVGQPHVVEQLTTTGNTQGIRRGPQDVGEMEMLKDQVVQLDREERKVTVQLEKERKRAEDEMCTAREEIRKAKEETSQARQETGQANIETKRERLKIVALEYEKSRCPASHHHQINDSLPSWTQWNVHMPHYRWPYNRMGEIEGRLVVGGYDGNLHVLTYKHDKWDMLSERMVT